MNQTAHLILRGAGEGKTYSLVGDVYTVLAAGRETGGAYTLISATVPPDGGPPPHRHSREAECFYILEGDMTFQVDDRTWIAGPGTFVQIPKGTVHAFKNSSSALTRMLIQCVPAGFDQFLAEIGIELSSPNDPPVPPTREEIQRLIEIAPKYGIEILPPPIDPNSADQ